jgi:rRNA-processing protein FCF1
MASLDNDSRRKAVFYVDTNVFLHYRHFAEMDWFAICPDKQVERIHVRIAPAVLDDLDSLKYSHQNKKIRHRITELISRIDQIVESHNGKVGSNIFLELETAEPDLTIYQKFKLIRTSTDDRLLASVLENILSPEGSQLYLVTNDIALKHKARSRDLAVLTLPPEFKLPEEADSRDRQIAELKTLLERQGLRAPDLKLTFPDLKNWAEVRLNSNAPPSQAQVKARLGEIRNAYPKQDQDGIPHRFKQYAHVLEKADPNSVKLGDIIGGLAFEALKTSVTISNMKLDTFYQEYEAYLASDALYLTQLARTIHIPIVIENIGTCPADDVDVHIKFPLGMKILLKDSLPQRPTPPVAPGQAKALNLPPASVAQVETGSKFLLRSVFDGTVCAINISRLKHLFRITLPPLYVVFDGEETIRSFTIQFVLHASNIPHQIKGELHLNIRRQQTRSALRRRRQKAIGAGSK